jgi:hypothetical protein
MRSDTERKLNRLAWEERAPLALVVAIVLASAGAFYATIYWPDPVVETRIVSGEVKGGTRGPRGEARPLVIYVALADGREFTIVQPPLDIPRYGPAAFEERRHKSGRISYLWLKSKSD